jgi:hypothetical protein
VIKDIEGAASATGLQIDIHNASTASEIEKAFTAFVQNEQMPLLSEPTRFSSSVACS